MQITAATAAADRRSTCQLLVQHARHQPTAVAIADGNFQATYRALAAGIVQAMDALTAAGLKRGQVAGVEIAERHVHLIILLACEAMEVTTISLVRSDLGPPAHLAKLCDRILASQIIPECDPNKLLLITGDWVRHVLTSPVDDGQLDAMQRPPAPDGFVRLLKTSGTTGAPKVMAVTYRLQLQVNEKALLAPLPFILPHPDYLCLYRFSIRANYTRILLTLRLGGTIHLVDMDTLWDSITAGVGNFILFVTGELERWIPTIPSGRGPFKLHVDVIGAAVSARLRRETQAKLTQHVRVIYGSNEVHHITSVDENDVGTLCDGVHVMITDGAGAPLPLGQHGLIRVKTGAMVDGYIDAPELTRASFVDGWYNTGDFGFQPSPDQLVLLGRADGMMNIGGFKIAPTPVEERLKAIHGVLDAVVTDVTDPRGICLLLVAIETGISGEPPELGASVKAVVEQYATPYQIMTLQVFPRTETGKITRAAVQQIYRTAAQTLHPAKSQGVAAN